MTEQLKQITKEELAKLPTEIQNAVNSLDWGWATDKVGALYDLKDEQINKLQTEVLLVLISSEDLADLKINIENNVGINKSDTEKIVDELIKKVFNPIAVKIDGDVKKGLQSKKISWSQSVDFIISGGDYSKFI